MKWWIPFVLVTVICWGAYVPILHHGQSALGGKNTALRAFLFVGLAYLIVAAGVLVYLVGGKSEPWAFTKSGAMISTVAGILGAFGALGVVFALKNGGKPILIAPLVFAGAPIVNTLVSMIWDRPEKSPHVLFYAGILLAAGGAALALRFKPV